MENHNIYQLDINGREPIIKEFFATMKEIEYRVFPWLEIRFPDTWQTYSNHQKVLRERAFAMDEHPYLTEERHLIDSKVLNKIFFNKNK